MLLTSSIAVLTEDGLLAPSEALLAFEIGDPPAATDSSCSASSASSS